VSFQIAGHQTEHYRIQTSIYEGPLDLLLELIEHAELDITALALAQVTDQYLSYLKNLEDRDPAEVSAFLVIASRLLQIKSAALLPRPSFDAPLHEEEDPGEALARQLIIYKRFKELAAVLMDREAKRMQTHLRVAPPMVKVEPHLDLSGVGVRDLLRAARGILLAQPNLPALSHVVSRPRITIREKIGAIISAIRRIGHTTFRALLQVQNDRLELVVTFLAMLELIKRRAVNAEQIDLFGDIHIQAAEDLDENEALAEVEFIE
jgi:segregation and condensation protein A